MSASIVVGVALVLLLWPRPRTRVVPVTRPRTRVLPVLLPENSMGDTATAEARRRVGALGARRRRQAQARASADALAAVIDVFAVVVGSGGTLSEALRHLAVRGPAAVTAAADDAVALRASGVGVSDVLRRFGERLGPGYRPVISVMVSAERDGAPLALVLERLSSEARATRRLDAETRARRLPVQLMFPLVVCSLPAVVIGAVVPLVAVSFGRLG